MFEQVLNLQIKRIFSCLTSGTDLPVLKSQSFLAPNTVNRGWVHRRTPVSSSSEDLGWQMWYGYQPLIADLTGLSLLEKKKNHLHNILLKIMLLWIVWKLKWGKYYALSHPFKKIIYLAYIHIKYVWEMRGFKQKQQPLIFPQIVFSYFTCKTLATDFWGGKKVE